MIFHPNKPINFMLRLLYWAVISALIYLGFKYALRHVLPLLIAYLISAVIIRPVDWLSDKGVPRKLTSVLFTLLTVTLLCLMTYWLILTLIYEGSQLVLALPGMISDLAARLETAQVAFDDLFVHLPQFIKDASIFNLESWLANLKMPEINVGGALSSAAGLAGALPGFLISLVFVFVATYFLTSEREPIMSFVRRQIGPQASQIMAELRAYFFSSVLSWVKAQGILICVTFVLLCVWFAVLRQPYALLLALLIALIDALPILGVGTVMIPWALIDLVSGQFRHAVFMILIYASVLIVRNSIEPKVVGAQLGIHPFVSLLCVFFGFRLAGFAGMFLLPMLVLCLMKLQETGRIQIWK